MENSHISCHVIGVKRKEKHKYITRSQIMKKGNSIFRKTAKIIRIISEIKIIINTHLF